MSKLRVLPHRTCDCTAVKLQDWQIAYPNQNPEPTPDYLEGFDYGSELRFGFSASVDLERVRSATGLDKTSRVGVYIIVDCEASKLRRRSFLVADGSEQQVWITIEPGLLAGSVTLGRGLVTIAGGPADGRDVPSRSGSRLWDDESRVVTLEGNLSRFPVESADFAATGRPANAAWMVETNFEDLNESFLGTVRLLVNLAHPAGAAVLDRAHTTTTELYSSALRADIARQLLQALVNDDRVKSVKDASHESVFGVVNEMFECQLRMDLNQALEKLRKNPSLLDAQIQDSFSYLGNLK